MPFAASSRFTDKELGWTGGRGEGWTFYCFCMLKIEILVPWEIMVCERATRRVNCAYEIIIRGVGTQGIRTSGILSRLDFIFCHHWTTVNSYSINVLKALG